MGEAFNLSRVLNKFTRPFVKREKNGDQLRGVKDKEGRPLTELTLERRPEYPKYDDIFSLLRYVQKKKACVSAFLGYPRYRGAPPPYDAFKGAPP